MRLPHTPSSLRLLPIKSAAKEKGRRANGGDRFAAWRRGEVARNGVRGAARVAPTNMLPIKRAAKEKGRRAGRVCCHSAGQPGHWLWPEYKEPALCGLFCTGLLVLHVLP